MTKREKRLVKGKMATVVIKEMTSEEARLEFPYRPVSERIESRHCGNQANDDEYFLSSGSALICKMCRAPTLKVFIDQTGVCPDCNGLAELKGLDPRVV